MESKDESNNFQPSVEERRLRLDEKRLLLDNSFAKKWLPTLVTLMVGLIAAMFSYVQQQRAIQTTKQAQEATERTRIEAGAKDEREYGFKVIEMYFAKRELFDLAKNPKQAESNLKVLAAVAPKAVKGVLNTERDKIFRSNGVDESNRLESLSAVAGVQDALANARQSSQAPASSFKPSDFTIYVQYPDGGRGIAVKAQSLLGGLGYRVPGIEQVAKAPSRLQVRYYRENQRSFAEELATGLGKGLNLPAGPDHAILVKSSQKLPSGILEVWLPTQRS